MRDILETVLCDAGALASGRGGSKGMLFNT